MSKIQFEIIAPEMLQERYCSDGKPDEQKIRAEIERAHSLGMLFPDHWYDGVEPVQTSIFQEDNQQKEKADWMGSRAILGLRLWRED